MIRIEPSSLAHLDAYRTTRLAALKETPLAFGSTYAHESTFTDAQWRERVARDAGERSCMYLAFDGQTCCGLAGAFRREESGRATLFSMWVAPTHRRLGVGRRLADACIDWCRLKGLRTLDLLVTDWNVGAIRFYERLGFELTGKTEPYPNDPALREFEMARAV